MVLECIQVQRPAYLFSQADMQAKRVENPLTYGGKTDMLRETYQNTGRTKMTDSDMV